MFTHNFFLPLSALAIYFTRQPRSTKTSFNQLDTSQLNRRFRYLPSQYMHKSVNQFFINSQNEKNSNEQF